MGKFYGIGVGPGEPELITLKALKAIEKADIIVAPKAKAKTDSFARSIVEKLAGKGKEFFEIEFPMTKNEDILRKRYMETSDIILKKIKEGKTVAYLCIGDPLLYSTYIYLLSALKHTAPELSVETIPGISAYSAIAARFNYPVAKKDERVCICPVPEDIEELKKVIAENDTVVIMKLAKKLPDVINLLKEMNLLHNAVFASRVGLEGEKLAGGTAGAFAVSEKEGYLSTIIVRKK